VVVCVSTSADYLLYFLERIIKLHTHRNTSFIQMPAMPSFLVYFAVLLPQFPIVILILELGVCLIVKGEK